MKNVTWNEVNGSDQFEIEVVSEEQMAAVNGAGWGWVPGAVIAVVKFSYNVGADMAKRDNQRYGCSKHRR